MTLDLSIADLLTALLAGGAVLVGLGVGVLLLRRRDRRASRFLGGFLVAAALTLAHEVTGALEMQRLSEHFWITPLLYTFALGPLLYAFTRSALDGAWQVTRRHAPHLVLPLYQLAHEVLTGFAPLSVKTWFWQTPYARMYNSVDVWVFVVSFGLYLTAAMRHVRRADARDETRWLLRLVRGCTLILGVAVATEVAHRTLSRGGTDWLQLGSSVAYSALVYWAAFTGWAYALPPRAAPRPAAPPRRETYGMSADDLERHAAALRQLMSDERPYLDPDLTLDALARRLGLSGKELSYVVNEGLGTGYTALVNGARADEAARRLADPAEAESTILQIGLASGFASKATFNRAFKQATGRTPSAYRAAPSAS